MDNKWHYIKNNEYPEVQGEYEYDNYPQIPCLVEDHGFVNVLCWNVRCNCWDDGEGDDYYCDKDKPSRWRYLDPLLDEN